MAGYLLEKAAFSGADALWLSMQNKINGYVNNHSGESTINEPKLVRPKVREALYDLLKQNYPLNYVPCGN
ncbi:MAG: hypothetical protein P1U56_03480 [Saprospiraceae bacterium]|nr:hypothetical protein [Saprospiraceae bacterium]